MVAGAAPPPIQRDLDATFTDLQRGLDATFPDLPRAIGRPTRARSPRSSAPRGPLADRLGRRRILAWSKRATRASEAGWRKATDSSVNVWIHFGGPQRKGPGAHRSPAPRSSTER